MYVNAVAIAKFWQEIKRQVNIIILSNIMEVLMNHEYPKFNYDTDTHIFCILLIFILLHATLIRNGKHYALINYFFNNGLGS